MFLEYLPEQITLEAGDAPGICDSGTPCGSVVLVSHVPLIKGHFLNDASLKVVIETVHLTDFIRYR
jgi:hypothetical protein